MKRIVIATVSALLVSVSALAQPGIIAGLTSSSTSVKDMEDVKALNTYHAGLTCKVDLGLGFAVQPSIIYQVKGANLGDINKDTQKEDFQLKTGFVEVPVQLQWGPDLLAFRPYLFAEPFIGYQVSSDDEVLGSGQSGAFKEWADQAKTKLEYGIGLGAGIEVVKHVQLSAQYFSNFGNLFTETVNEDGSAGTAMADVKTTVTEGVKNFQGIKVSLAFIF